MRNVTVVAVCDALNRGINISPVHRVPGVENAHVAHKK